ncbi:MAG: flagellar export chaperone FliS [Phycisphaerae bacterium]
MTPTPSDEYLRSAVLTATPEQLQMMLYDGAIRFATQGREALERHDYSTSCEQLLRAQKIVVELENGLRPEVNPSLCQQLAALYRFVYRRLVDANVHQDPDAADDALRILHHQRTTWEMLLQRLASEAAATAGEATPVEPAGSPISIEC